MGRRSKITPELIDKIAEKIRQGSFAHVAAEACGIGRATLYRWLDYAEQGRGGLFARFRDECRLAKAEARANAESRVFKDAPFQWLRFGPGRDRGHDDPGWTERSQLELDAHMKHSDVSIEIPCPASREVIAQGLVELRQIGLKLDDPRLFRQIGMQDGNGADDGAVEAEPATRYLPAPSTGNGDRR